VPHLPEWCFAAPREEFAALVHKALNLVLLVYLSLLSLLVMAARSWQLLIWRLLIFSKDSSRTIKRREIVGM